MDAATSTATVEGLYVHDTSEEGYFNQALIHARAKGRRRHSPSGTTTTPKLEQQKRQQKEGFKNC
jgi:hypothetical protein